MGGASSTHGGLAISFENSSCFAGQVVSGAVHISVTAPTNQGTLYLRFKGSEKTAWTTTTRTKVLGKYVTTVNYHSGRHKICNVSYPIYQFDHGLEPGGYSLPFCFRLPENIPSSLSFSEGSTGAHIFYKFHAKFVGISGEVIKGKEIIHMRQAVYALQRDLAQKKNAVLKTWCCVNKGSCEVDVSYPQDTFNPLQHATFYAIVDNSLSKLSITSVTCNFGFTLRLREDGSQTFLVKRTVISKTIPLSIPPGTCGKSNPIEFTLHFDDVRAVLENMFTTRGHLIECIYTTEIEARTDGSCMCCGDYANIISPINIIPSLTYVAPPPPRPQDWSPTILDSVTLAYDTKYDVPLVGKPKSLNVIPSL